MAWKKLLWVKQPYADNYVDSTFLSQLKRNSGVRRYEYWSVVADWSVLTLNLALCVVFAEVFTLIHRGELPPSHASLAATVPSVILAAMLALEERNSAKLVATAKLGVLIVLAVRALSPVFLSLTKTTSSDSIWSITAWLCFANMIFGSRSPKEGSQILVLSTNVALTATIVLASRLNTADAVFHFMIFSIQTYVLLPAAARYLKMRSRSIYWTVVFAAAVTADALTFWVFGPLVVVALQLALTLASLAFPGLFLLLQKYKDQIEGPWDPARPIIPDDD